MSPSLTLSLKLEVYLYLLLLFYDKCLHSYEISSQYNFSYIPLIFFTIFFGNDFNFEESLRIKIIQQRPIHILHKFVCVHIPSGIHIFLLKQMHFIMNPYSKYISVCIQAV